MNWKEEALEKIMEYLNICCERNIEPSEFYIAQIYVLSMPLKERKEAEKKVIKELAKRKERKGLRFRSFIFSHQFHFLY